ncbi:DUF6309 family protein [Kitasatospora sp. NPDC058170]|uniref:DUF6309 family protein n=1 Tax=Kitasatospora sp. NPDC058170 TaxID=3346364 RepID=UPI0036DA7987
MRILARTDFETVLRRYRRDHPVDREHEDNSNSDGDAHLLAAEGLFGGWGKVLLDRADVLDTVLPWHLGEGGELELVPATGMTVAEAVERLRGIGDGYGGLNPSCGRKLRRQADAPFTPVFLSVPAIGSTDYQGLLRSDGLTHLDGLHRMIAWELYGRLGPGVEIEAYVAGLPGATATATATAPATGTATATVTESTAVTETAAGAGTGRDARRTG